MTAVNSMSPQMGAGLDWIQRLCEAGGLAAADTLACVCAGAQQLIQAERLSALAFTSAPGAGEARVAACPSAPDAVGTLIDVRRYPEIGLAAETLDLVVIDDVRRDERFAELRDTLPPGLQSVAALPLPAAGRALGVLHVRSSRPVHIEAPARALLAAAASVAGLALASRPQQLAEATQQERLVRNLRASNRRLRRLGQIRDELIAVCSHDLRAPLTVAAAHVDLLLRGKIGPLGERQVQSVMKIRRQGERMLALIDELLGARARGMDSLEVRPEPGDLGALVRECAEEMTIAFHQRRIRLVTDVDPGLPACRFDAGQLRKVLTNLLSNALKFTPEGGAVTVTLTADERLRLRVADTGPGIPPDAVDRIFEPYQRGDGARGTAGYGLGLAICSEIVERHGGEIWVESRPGAGAVFHVALPADVAHPGAAAPARSRQIAIIDDDPEVLEATAELLRQAGYGVTTLSDGREGIPEVRGAPPDLILLDIKMPALSGFDVAQRLKRDARTASVPIVFLSGSGLVEDRVRGLQVGGDAVLVKPFYGEELVAQIERSLAAADERARMGALNGREGIAGEGRRQATDRFANEVARARRHGHPLSVAVLELDRLGEADAGALARLGELVRAEARSTDLVLRWGAAAVLAVLPHATRDEAAAFAERVRGHTDAPVSAGVAALAPAEAGLAEALARAEAALRAAHAAGGERVAAG